MTDQRLYSPPASSPRTHAVMRGNRARDTKFELALRSALHRRGLRFRKQVQAVPGLRFRVDVAFPADHVAIECRGCFWHRCPADAVLPKSNLDYWLPKLQRNVDRDGRNEQALAAAGWALIVVWEHEPVEDAADRIAAFLEKRRAGIRE